MKDYEDVRPRCIFCQQRYSLANGADPRCDDERNAGRPHVEFWNSTREDRDRRFGPITPPPDLTPPPPRGQAGFGL